MINGIQDIIDVIYEHTDGDLTVEYQVTSKDEMGRLATVSKETTKSFRELVRKIKEEKIW